MMQKNYASYSQARPRRLAQRLLLTVLAGLGSLVAIAQSCPPVSQLPCGQLQVSLPYSLHFSGPRAGLPDKNGAGTGFTLDRPDGEGS